MAQDDRFAYQFNTEQESYFQKPAQKYSTPLKGASSYKKLENDNYLLGHNIHDEFINKSINKNLKKLQNYTNFETRNNKYSPYGDNYEE